MLRLIIETSNLDFQLGLHDGRPDGGYVYRSDEGDGSSELTEMLASGLEKADREIGDIGEIVVDLGPGGLTSTRSGIAFANGLAFARDIKIVGIDSLELMVLQIDADPNDHVIAARRSNDGNYFLGFFHGGECLKVALGKPLELIEQLGWGNEKLLWIGPRPKSWVDEPPSLNIEFNDLMSPGLDAFQSVLGSQSFAERPRQDAAGPMNELIR